MLVNYVILTLSLLMIYTNISTVLATFLLVIITFSNFGCKIAISTVQAENTQKWYFLVLNPNLKKKKFLWYSGPHL